MKIILTILFFALNLCFFPAIGVGATFFNENFDDTNFSSRGWYDGPTGAVDTNVHIPGSTASLKCHFLQGGTKCNPADGDYTLRHKFTASDSVYVSYWVKHSANWVGSGKTYHPHQFFILTNLNGDYDGMAWTHLTAYVEENQGYPQLNIQDGQNIDMTKIGVDLTNVTESRSIGGCNGTQPGLGQDYVDCYPSGSMYWNGIDWKGPTAYFFDAAQIVNWHQVEAYYQLNTIANGKGQPNGIVRYWYDGQLVIDHSNVIIRTAQNPTMQFDQLVFSPYIGDGSPADQTFWIDNLTVASAKSGGSPTSVPSPPVNLRVQ
jgi:hypothetical protein